MALMKKTIVSTPSKGTGKRSVVRGLRTGKIYAKKASAREILQSVGVRPSEEKVAAKALRAAAPAPKSVKLRVRKPTGISARKPAVASVKNL